MTTSTPVYFNAADILANARISDQPEIMQLDQLDAHTLMHIVTVRLYGYHPVSVRWPGGLFALMFCEPGTNMPDPQKVISAYLHCVQTSKVYPEGNSHGIY